MSNQQQACDAQEGNSPLWFGLVLLCSSLVLEFSTNKSVFWFVLSCTHKNIRPSLWMSYRMQSAIWTAVSLWTQICFSSCMPSAGLLLLPRYSDLLLPYGWWGFPLCDLQRGSSQDLLFILLFLPLAECTADGHFVFSIPASLTDPPLSPALLVAAGNSSCTPQKVVADLALFKIPLDGCGARKYVREIVHRICNMRSTMFK